MKISEKLTFALIFGVILTIFSGNRCWAKEPLLLKVLDVGYGQAVHVQVGYSHYLFDTGPRDSVNELIESLSKEFVTRLSGIFLSHTHPDHAGALLSLVSQINTDTVYWNEELPNDEDLISEFEKAKKITKFQRLEPGTHLNLGRHTKLYVLKQNLKTNNLNDNSLVFGLKHGSRKILLPGDAGIYRQDDLAQIESKWLKKTNFLLWPHHGDELSPTFMKALGEVKFCVVSVGENPYKLPAASLSEQTQDLCQLMLRTDQAGTLTFFVGRKIKLYRGRKEPIIK